MTPETTAGKALLSMFPLYGERIAAVEQEARRAVLAELRAEVEGLKADTTDTSGGTFFWGMRGGANHAIDAILAAIDRRLGGSEPPADFGQQIMSEGGLPKHLREEHR